MGDKVSRVAFLVFFAMLIFFTSWFLGPVQQAQAAEEPASSFSDLDTSDENYPYVKFLQNRGIIDGFPDGSFRPLGSLTRGEAAKMLMVAVGEEGYLPDTPSYPDVSNDHWAFPYVEGATQKGYLTGFPDGSFRPDGLLTRAETALILYRVYGVDYEWMNEPLVTDLPPWAYDAINGIIDAGLMGIDDDGFFQPDADTTRMEFARAFALLHTIHDDWRFVPLQATLVPKDGQVQLGRDGRNLERITRPSLLAVGDLIIVGPNAEAEIQFEDGSGMLLQPNSELKVQKLLGNLFILPDGTTASAVDDLEVEFLKGSMFGALATRGVDPEAMALNETATIWNSLPLLAMGNDNWEAIGYASDAVLGASSQVQPIGSPAVGNLPPWKQLQLKKVRVKVNMPYGVAAVRGSFWKVELRQVGNQIREIINFIHGEGEVQNGEHTVVLSAGQTTTVETPDTPPSPPRAMSIGQQREWVTVKDWVTQRAEQIKERIVEPSTPPAPGGITPSQPSASTPSPIIPGVEPATPTPAHQLLQSINTLLNSMDSIEERVDSYLDSLSYSSVEEDDSYYDADGGDQDREPIIPVTPGDDDGKEEPDEPNLEVQTYTEEVSSTNPVITVTFNKPVEILVGRYHFVDLNLNVEIIIDGENGAFGVSSINGNEENGIDVRDSKILIIVEEGTTPEQITITIPLNTGFFTGQKYTMILPKYIFGEEQENGGIELDFEVLEPEEGMGKKPLNGVTVKYEGSDTEPSEAIRVDDELHAMVDPGSADAQFQWIRASFPDEDEEEAPTLEDISNAIKETYTVTEADIGKYIIVKATGTADYTGTIFSDAYLVLEDKDIGEPPCEESIWLYEDAILLTINSDGPSDSMELYFYTDPEDLEITALDWEANIEIEIEEIFSYENEGQIEGVSITGLNPGIGTITMFVEDTNGCEHTLEVEVVVISEPTEDSKPTYAFYAGNKKELEFKVPYKNEKKINSEFIGYWVDPGSGEPTALYGLSKGYELVSTEELQSGQYRYLQPENEDGIIRMKLKFDDAEAIGNLGGFERAHSVLIFADGWYEKTPSARASIEVGNLIELVNQSEFHIHGYSYMTDDSFRHDFSIPATSNEAHEIILYGSPFPDTITVFGLTEEEEMRTATIPLDENNFQYIITEDTEWEKPNVEGSD